MLVLVFVAWAVLMMYGCVIPRVIVVVDGRNVLEVGTGSWVDGKRIMCYKRYVHGVKEVRIARRVLYNEKYRLLWTM